MPKRGTKLPWRLTTTWAHTDIKPFMVAFLSEREALDARLQRMRIDNRHGSESIFVITHRERPDYVAPVALRCHEHGCSLWGTQPDPRGMDMVCAEHEEEIWEEMEERTAREADAGVSWS